MKKIFLAAFLLAGTVAFGASPFQQDTGMHKKHMHHHKMKNNSDSSMHHKMKAGKMKRDSSKQY